jgi:type II secretory pathway component PulK
MATQNASLRNTIAAAYGTALNRLDLLDGATVVATVTVTLSAGSTGVVTVDPDAATVVNAGTVDGATLYHSTPAAEITGITVSTIADGTGDITLSSLTYAVDETINLTAFSLTIPAS